MKTIKLNPDASAPQILRYHFNMARYHTTKNEGVRYIAPELAKIYITPVRNFIHRDNIDMYICRYSCITYDDNKTNDFICIISLNKYAHELSLSDIKPEYRIIDSKTMNTITTFRESDVVGSIDSILESEDHTIDLVCPYCSSPLHSVRWVDYKINSFDDTIIDVEACCTYVSIDKEPWSFGYDLTPVFKALINNAETTSNASYTLASLLPSMRDGKSDIDLVMKYITDGRRNIHDVKYTKSQVPGPYCRGCGQSLRDHFIENGMNK